MPANISNAERHLTARLDKAAKAQWLEMGVLSISFVVITRPDGRVGVQL